MTQPRHFASYTAARTQFRAVLDAASAGLVTPLCRDDDRFVMMPAEELRAQLAALRPSRAEVVQEGGGWAVILPGLPVHGDAPSFDEALDDAMVALREYAEDWNDQANAVMVRRGPVLGTVVECPAPSSPVSRPGRPRAPTGERSCARGRRALHRALRVATRRAAAATRNCLLVASDDVFEAIIQV